MTDIYYFCFINLPGLLHLDNIWLVNIAAKDWGYNIRGMTLYEPNIIVKESIDTIICPNQPSVFRAISDEVKRNFPQVKHIYSINELLFESL
jgi:hypothetical protein